MESQATIRQATRSWATRKGNSSSPRSHRFDQVQLRLHARSLSPPPTTQKPHADNVRSNAHLDLPNGNLPTKSHPPLHISSRNPSSWCWSNRERGPKRSRLAQLRCRWCSYQDRWYDWVLRYVLFLSSPYPTPPSRFAYIHGLNEIGITQLVGLLGRLNLG